MVNPISANDVSIEFTILGRINIDGRTKTLYRRAGYISSYEITKEIARLNKLAIESFQKKDDAIHKVKKFTVSFQLITEIRSKGRITKTTQKICPTVDLLRE